MIRIEESYLDDLRGVPVVGVAIDRPVLVPELHLDPVAHDEMPRRRRVLCNTRHDKLACKHSSCCWPLDSSTAKPAVLVVLVA